MPSFPKALNFFVIICFSLGSRPEKSNIRGNFFHQICKFSERITENYATEETILKIFSSTLHIETSKQIRKNVNSSFSISETFFCLE